MHVYFVSGTMPGTSHMFLLILAIALWDKYFYFYVQIQKLKLREVK